MSHLSHQKSACNTIRLRQNKNEKVRKRARIWSFTYNNYKKEDLSHLRSQIFFSDLKIIKYLIQEEIGANGTKHLQGTVQFENQVDFTMLKKMHPNIHWEKCRNFTRSMKYCGKLESRNGEIFTYGEVSEYIEVIQPKLGDLLKTWRKENLGIDDDERKEHRFDFLLD